MSNRHYIASRMLFALALLPGAVATADAADVWVADARIAGGKLVITGTTASANTWIRLDERTGSEFNVKSGAGGVFSFSLVYHPGDCIVELQKLVSPTTLGAATAALVANCGPTGISPRGAWSATARYPANDLVTYEGSSWRAKRENAGREPGAAAVWELFAAKGDAADGSGGDARTADGGSGPDQLTPPTGPAGGVLTGTYPNPGLANLVVTTPKLANAAVTAAKIANDTITGVQIAPNAIGLGRLANNAVNSAKVVDNSLTANDLATNSVGTAELADNAVTSARIADGTITGADVASDTLTAVDIAPNAIGTSELADNAVIGVRIATGAITSEKVLDDTEAGGGLTAADLRFDSVGNSELQANAVSSANIINSTITGADVANNSLTTADIDGASINGQVNLNGVPNGRCIQVNLAVPGSEVGEAAVIALNGAVQNGIIFYPQRVSANGTVQANICNFTGGAMDPIVNMPVKVITFN